MTVLVRKPLRVAVLAHESLLPPDSIANLTDKEIQPWKMEWDVTSCLRDIGHQIELVGLHDELTPVRQVIETHKPQIIFNLLEEFHGAGAYVPHVISYLELKKQKYTGCNPRGLTLANDKGLSKKILAYHRIHVPHFAVFPLKQKIRRPHRLDFPLLVKSISLEGSAGISQASVVRDDGSLVERVRFIHRQHHTHAIAEQYIEGREIYVGVIGNQRLQTFTPWELIIKRLPDGAANIATGKVKWDYDYQEKVGVLTEAAKLEPRQVEKLAALSKRIYRILGICGYARLDFRLNRNGDFYLLEANPNPNLSYGEDFAESAEHSGIGFEPLINKILSLGLSYEFVGF